MNGINMLLLYKPDLFMYLLLFMYLFYLLLYLLFTFKHTLFLQPALVMIMVPPVLYVITLLVSVIVDQKDLEGSAWTVRYRTL